MQDTYERKIDYVRISITDRCNLRCVYCMPEEGVVSVSHTKILRYDEIVHLCEVFATLGVTKIKLTGGEPLVRKNIQALIADIKAVEGIQKVTLTTNGILLEELADTLVDAGIDAVNVSLDTLDAEHFSAITRGGDIEKVRRGIMKMLSYPEVPLKVNCVPNDISDKEIIEVARLAKENRIHVRFIELMPIGTGKEIIQEHKEVYDQEERIKNLLEKEFGTLSFCNQILGNGPSQYWSIEGFEGKIGFISAISHKFCEQCNRVRVTAGGYLKTCLQYEVGEDLFPLLREGGTDEELEMLIRKAISKKPKAHEFLGEEMQKGHGEKEHKSMSQIGG